MAPRGERSRWPSLSHRLREVNRRVAGHGGPEKLSAPLPRASAAPARRAATRGWTVRGTSSRARASTARAHAPEAPQVSPKPFARSRATRSLTVNRPASAIPLAGPCAASDVQHVARLRAASCATPASLPLRAHGTQSLRGRTSPGPALRAEGSGGAGESRAEFFGPDGTGDAPVHLVGPMRKRKPEVLFTSQSPVGRRPKKLGASCSPRRSGGQGTCLPLPCQKIWDKGEAYFGFDFARKTLA